MSGETNDERSRRQGYYEPSTPASQSRGRDDNQRYDDTNYSRAGQMQGGRDYLGAAPKIQVRDPSFDGHASETDLSQLSRHDSRTPLTPPPPAATQQSSGYFLPPGATQPSSALGTPIGNPVKVVHYPPSPQLPHNDRNDRSYTSIPLNDSSPAQNNEKASGSRSTTPQPGTGTSTPRRRPFSFIPMQANNYSTQSVDSSGGSAEKKKRPKTSRSQSWDLLGERPEWEEYNPSQAKQETLRFAEGDVGTNKLSRFYYWALNSSIIVRWIFYIVPVLAILWIPGIIALTGIPDAKVWEVGLLWWSIWLSVLWGGFWASTAAFLMIPGFWRTTVGSIVPSAKKYTDVIRALGRYAKLVPWAAAVWISFTPLIINHYSGAADSTSRTNLTTMVNILFGLFLCSIVLGIEKLIVQLIALQFHQDSYADRLADQKFQIRALTTLYMNSHDIPGRSDTLTDAESRKTKGSQIPKVAIRKALRGLREVAQTTTTALGNVASEMAGQSVLQTNSPANKVTAALSSANKSKALARRLFYSFRAPGAASLDIQDIARFFPDLETANSAFAVFDVDGNGDATRDELESAVLALHRERLSLEASMRDLDGAVRRLDDIFMVFVFVIVVLILAAVVTTRLTSFVTSAGTFVLGLSWLIGTTMQEILLACIFLFVKHPYDVGDRVDIDGNSYTVAKMQLLSTNFKRVDGKFVWIGHNILATKIIENVRRSGPTSESFSFEVAFDTTFEALQALRGRMLIFVKENTRDYLPIFDVIVDDIPGQSKMVLKADIKYKSNWQQGALKVQRRNKWICALKMTLSDLKIWGPAGAGDPAPAPADPVRYTMVPWEEVNAAATTAAAKPESPPPTFHAATTAGVGLMDRRQVMNDTSAGTPSPPSHAFTSDSVDIWGEEDDASNFGPTRPGTPGTMTPAASTSMGHSAALDSGPVVGPARTRVAHGQTGESIEMVSAPVARRQ